MSRFTKAALLAVATLFCSSLHVQAESCSHERAEQLLTTVLYRETVPTRAAHASAMVIILTALNAGHRGSNLCEVMTNSGFLKHAFLKDVHIEPAKLASSNADAKLFLGQYWELGTVPSVSEVAAQLRDADSFKAGSTCAGKIAVIGDNCFYKAASPRKSKRRHK